MQQFEAALAWYKQRHMPLGPVSVEDIDRLSEFKQLFTSDSASTESSSRNTVVTGSKRARKTTKRIKAPTEKANGTLSSGLISPRWLELLRTEPTAEDLSHALGVSLRKVRAEIKHYQSAGVPIITGEGEQTGGRGRPKATYKIPSDWQPPTAN